MAGVVQTEMRQGLTELVTAEVSSFRLVQHIVVVRAWFVPKLHS